MSYIAFTITLPSTELHRGISIKLEAVLTNQEAYCKTINVNVNPQDIHFTSILLDFRVWVQGTLKYLGLCLSDGQ